MELDIETEPKVVPEDYTGKVKIKDLSIASISLDLMREHDHVAWVEARPMPGKFVLTYEIEEHDIVRKIQKEYTSHNKEYTTMGELVDAILDFETERRSKLGELGKWCELFDDTVLHSISFDPLSMAYKSDWKKNPPRYKVSWCEGKGTKKRRTT